jgi:hypothetical protein
MRAALVQAGLALVILAPGYADDSDLERRVAELEEQIKRDDWEDTSSNGFHPGEWTRNFHLSGNADFTYLHGEAHSLAGEGRVAVENARFFVDVDLGGESRFGETTLLKSASLHFEWDLVREGSLKNRVGSLFVRMNELFGVNALNFQMGRMPIPFGEEYLRFHQQRPENPLISYSVAAPYNWDEGGMLFGSLAEGRVRYWIAVLNGDSGFSTNTQVDPSVALKFAWEPLAYTRLSLSGMRTGSLGGGSPGETGKSAIEWAGTHAKPVGEGGMPVFQNGALVPPDPSLRIDDVMAWEADLIIERPDLGRLWVAAGQAYIQSGGTSFYDRDFTYWIAELTVELGALVSALERFYFATRYSGIGTLDGSEGYLFEAMNEGGDLGYNTKRVDAVSVGVGFRIYDNLVFKTEASWFDFDLVSGASAFRAQARNRSYVGVGLTLGF